MPTATEAKDSVSTMRTTANEQPANLPGEGRHSRTQPRSRASLRLAAVAGDCGFAVRLHFAHGLCA